MSNFTLKPTFTWLDRGLICAWFLSSYDRVAGDNPSGWLDGVNGFDTYLNRAIPVVKELGAKRIIVWDSEGSGFEQGELYVGAPDQATVINPTVDYVSFFGKIVSAGITPGVLLRPSEFIEGKHTISPNPFQTLYRKALYAYKHWKCRQFYVDSNVEAATMWRPNGWADGPLISATVFARLHKAMPDCLFIPEHYDRGNYHLHSAPYMELRGGDYGTRSNILAQIPHAFSVLNLSEGDITGNRAILRENIQRGDIPLVNGWWRHGQVDDVIELMRTQEV